MQRNRLLPIIIASLVALVGCGAPLHEASEHYILVANNTKVPYWQAAVAGLNKAGASMNVKVDVAGPDNYDPHSEHDEFQKAIQKKPTGILVSAAAAKLIEPDINAAIAQGIPVITVDSDAENSKRLFFIGTDNYKAGTIGGRIVAQQLKGKGNVAFYTMPEQPNLYARLHGYQDTFATYPGLKTARVLDTKGDASTAFDLTKELLQSSGGKIDAFVCLESTACPEVADVLERQNVTGKIIVAMDTAPKTLERIQKGSIYATIGQKPYTMCFFGVKMLDDLHHHKLSTLDKKWFEDSFSPLPAFVDTGATLIDKSNVDGFMKSLQTETQK